MKILVTGSSGFVGSRTCARLEAAGHDVIRVSRSNKPGSRSEYLLDIAEKEEFARMNDIQQLDAIVHCAGIAHRFERISREKFWRVNVEGAKNVAEFAARKGVRRFVHLSSVLVYGMPTSNRPVRDDQTPAPADAYASSKLAGEMTVADVCSSAGIELTILRPVPIIGEGSRGNVARLIRAIDRKRFHWIGDGRNQRSFVYVDDVAAAVDTALSMQRGSATLNVTGGEITVREMVATISDHLGADRPLTLVPFMPAKMAMAVSRPLAKLPIMGRYHRTLETWLADAVYSGDGLTRLGFVPSTDIPEALRREVAAYLASTER